MIGKGDGSMVRAYYTIDEEGARAARQLNSFRDYESGSATREYKNLVDAVYEKAEQIAEDKPELAERAARMAEQYSRNLAKYYNDYYRNEASCPSVMISGAGNFPVKKKEKQNQRRESLMAEWDKLQADAEKIDNLLTMKQPILIGDENAIVLLKEKLEGLEAKQEMMKSVNAYYRKHKTLDNCPELTLEQIGQLKEDMNAGYHRGDKPFMSFELTNNNATIKNTRSRLEKLQREKEAGTQEYQSQYFTVVENKEIMRLQLVFEGKPDADIRNVLKSNGFRWSPKNNCWQRQLTDNARYSVKRVMQKLEGLERKEPKRQNLDKKFKSSKVR